MPPVNDYVQVICTVNCYRNMKNSCMQFDTAISFNVHKVIVLARAEKQYIGEQLNAKDHDLGSVDTSKLLPVDDSTEDGLVSSEGKDMTDNNGGLMKRLRYLQCM